MAEETTNVTANEQTDTSSVANQETENSASTPSVEELMAQLADARAEAQKNKAKADKASSEAAEYKKAIRAKQTAEEREAEEKAEAQRLADEEKENMRKELNHIKAVNAYKNIQENDTVELLVEAVSEADHAAIASIIENEKAKAVKEARAEWIKTAPPVNAGAGDKSISQAQFDSMNLSEKSKLWNENREEYNRLAGKK